MRNAKMGNWWEQNVQRALANNSVAYTEKPDVGTWMKEWLSIYESKSGERGIFNREAAKKQVEKIGRREVDHEWLVNPCSEIILRPNQVCNLSEAIVREGDNFEDLLSKVRIASILGSFQATLTNYRYVSSVWKRNAEEESLIGVSLTGIMDHTILSGRSDGGYKNDTWGGPVQLEDTLEELKDEVIRTNKYFAEKLGINQATATSCIKPSGTVSQLVDSSSGIHPRYSKFYIRTVRADKKDPLSLFMRAQRFPVEDDVTSPDSTDVFAFPMKAPGGSTYRNDMSAIDQLEHWLIYQRHFCEHKPSITVYVREDEWPIVGAWVYNHFDEISGVSFLPHSEHIYKQAPYQEITREVFETLSEQMPKNVNWSDLGNYETVDTTTGSKTYACSGGSCEVVDLI